jgi:hypothetical protein
MTLFQKLEDMVPLGYKVAFSHEPMHLVITISKEVTGFETSKVSWLPQSDHFKESKIIEHIEMMERDIQKAFSKLNDIEQAVKATHKWFKEYAEEWPPQLKTLLNKALE